MRLPEDPSDDPPEEDVRTGLKVPASRFVLRPVWPVGFDELAPAEEAEDEPEEDPDDELEDEPDEYPEDELLVFLLLNLFFFTPFLLADPRDPLADVAVREGEVFAALALVDVLPLPLA